MVAAKGTERRRPGYIATLSSSLSGVLLTVIGATYSLNAFYFAETKVVAWLASMVPPFCMMCATSIWSMREQITEMLDPGMMRAEEYARFTTFASQRREEVTRLTAWVTVAASLAFIAPSAHLMDGVIRGWMVLLCGAALGFSLFSYVRATHWERQTREYRDKRRIEYKRLMEKEQLINDIDSSRIHAQVSDGLPVRTMSRVKIH